MNVQFDFSERADGQVDVHLGTEWPLFNEALADSVSSLPPRGEDVIGPSTYWVDVALTGLEEALATRSDLPFIRGNSSLLRVRGGRVEARFDFADDDEVGEYMAVDDVRTVLREWRRRIELSAARATQPLPDTYRRNPIVRPRTSRMSDEAFLRAMIADPADRASRCVPLPTPVCRTDPERTRSHRPRSTRPPGDSSTRPQQGSDKVAHGRDGLVISRPRPAWLNCEAR